MLCIRRRQWIATGFAVMTWMGAGLAAAAVPPAAEPEDPALTAQLDKPLTLDDCIRIALEHNLALAAAEAAQEATVAGVDVAWGQFIPNLSLTASQVRTQTDLTTVRNRDANLRLVQQLPLGTTVEAGVFIADTPADSAPARSEPFIRVIQPLLRSAGWTVSTSSLQNARFSASSQDAQLAARRLLVVFEVTSAYYEILRRAQLVAVNERAVARDSLLVAFSEAKRSATLATTRDVLSAEIALAQDQGRLVNAEAQWRSALDQMSNILGVRIARDLEVAAVDLAPPPLQLDEEGWIARALSDNPTLQAGRVELERAELSRRLAANARLPQLDLAVAYGEQRNNFGGAVQQRAWEGAVSVAYPLLPKSLNGAYRRATLDAEQVQRAYEIAERQVLLAVRDGARNLQRSEDRIGILQKNIEGAQGKLEFANVNFRLGRASNLDITDAQRDLLDAETDLVNELVNYRLERARLEAILGGPL